MNSSCFTESRHLLHEEINLFRWEIFILSSSVNCLFCFGELEKGIPFSSNILMMPLKNLMVETNLLRLINYF